jgi:hypothetical protein
MPRIPALVVSGDNTSPRYDLRSTNRGTGFFVHTGVRGSDKKVGDVVLIGKLPDPMVKMEAQMAQVTKAPNIFWGETWEHMLAES